jgi:GNAT superfamily N-acetyltransferase
LGRRQRSNNFALVTSTQSPHYCRERDDGYVVSTDRSRLDLDVLRGFLPRPAGAPACPGGRRAPHRTLAALRLYAGTGEQVGFARVVTDFAVFAYLGEVLVLPAHRRRGLGAWLGAPATPEIHMMIERSPDELWPAA